MTREFNTVEKPLPRIIATRGSPIPFLRRARSAAEPDGLSTTLMTRLCIQVERHHQRVFALRSGIIVAPSACDLKAKMFVEGDRANVALSDFKPAHHNPSVSKHVQRLLEKSGGTPRPAFGRIDSQCVDVAVFVLSAADQVGDEFPVFVCKSDRHRYRSGDRTDKGRSGPWRSKTGSLQRD